MPKYIKKNTLKQSPSIARPQTNTKELIVNLAANFNPKISHIGPLKQLPITLPTPRKMVRIPYLIFLDY